MLPQLPTPEAPAEPLPPCAGPQTLPFLDAVPPDIEFLDILGEGLHSYVFRVRIQGQLYALKMVR